MRDMAFICYISLYFVPLHQQNGNRGVVGFGCVITICIS